MKRKLMIMLMAAMLAVICLPVGAMAAGTETQEELDASTASTVAVGKCGEGNLYWYLYSDGTLNIRYDSGSGDMYDYYPDERPWAEYLDDIKSIVIPSGVTRIGDYAFFGCTNLTSVTIPGSVETIGVRAFSYCSNLTTVTIKSGTKTLEGSVFADDTSLTTVTIPSTVTYIGGCTFTSVPWALKQGDLLVVNNCLVQCNNLDITEAVIPDGVTMIASNVFEHCENLHKVTIPDSVVSIGDSAFNCCSSLPSIVIPEGVTSIGSYVFSYSGISRIVLAKSVVNVEADAFAHCDCLKELNYTGTPEQWAKLNKSIKLNDSVDVLYGTHGMQITEQPPEYLEAIYGDTLSIGLQTEGDGLSYQWQYEDENHDWIDLSESSARTSVLTWSARLNRSWEYAYLHCVITDPDGVSITSRAVEVHVEATEMIVTSSPSDCTVQEGGTYYFTVQATGDDLRYIWTCTETMEDCEDVENASEYWEEGSWNTDTLTGTADSSYPYRVFYCTIMDVHGNTWETGDATLTIEDTDEGTPDVGHVVVPKSVKVTEQPENTSVRPGKYFSFHVAASEDDVTYQWQYSKDNGVTWTDSTITSAKTAKFSSKSAWSYDGRLYRCVLTDKYDNTVISDAAMLTIEKLEMSITSHPENLTVKAGTTYHFNVTAVGDDLTYQWQYSKDGGETWTNSTVSSAKTATLSAVAASSYSGRFFRCMVSDRHGYTMISGRATLTVPKELKITSQPAKTYVKSGAAYTFKVTASGDGLTYQWQYKNYGSTKWVNSTLACAKTATFKSTAVTSYSGRQYRCIIKDTYGNKLTSGTATLSVLGIKTQPKAMSVASGKNYSFTVAASGLGRTYQWQYSKDGGKTWTNSLVTSAKKATLTAKAYSSMNGRLFRCVVKDGAGNKVTTKSVKLTVK